MRIKLDGLRWNNIDLSVGLPEDIKAKCAKPEGEVFSAEASSRVPFFNNLYVAQHNFVDTEPVGTPVGGSPLALLPGQPMATPPTELGTRATHAYVSGSNLHQLIEAATGIGMSNVFQSIDISPNFLSSFERGGSVYEAIGSSENIGGGIWRWAGWGITYYTGLFRPALISQYPPLTIGQMPTVFTGNTFVIDYAKTEIIFNYNVNNGEVNLLHGEIK